MQLNFVNYGDRPNKILLRLNRCKILFGFAVLSFALPIIVATKIANEAGLYYTKTFYPGNGAALPTWDFSR